MAVGTVLALIVGWALWPRPTPEDAVRATILAVIDGAERGDVGDVFAPLAEDFVAVHDESSLPGSVLRPLLTREFLRRGPLTVLPGEISVTLTGTTAHAAFDAVLVEQGKAWGDFLPADADSWHVEADLLDDAGTWSVTRVEQTDAPLLTLPNALP